MGHVISFFDDVEEPAAEATSLAVGVLEAYERSTMSCEELRELGIPPRELVLGEFFREGDLGFIYAPRGLGKTWLSLGMAAAIANGGSCGVWQAHRPRRVLYVDGEMPAESVVQRVLGMGAGENLTVLNHEALFHLCGQSLNLAEPRAQNAMTEYLRREGVSVVVLDNLSCLFSGVSENDADSWEQVLGWLLNLRRHRIAVVMVHHSGRNAGLMRGTSRREDSAFWVIRLEPSSNGDGQGAQFHSRFTKNRNQPSVLTEVDWQFVTQPNGSVSVHAEISSDLFIFRQWVENGLTGAEDIAHEMGLSKGTVSKMARRAMDEGWLRKEGREYALV